MAQENQFDQLVPESNAGSEQTQPVVPTPMEPTPPVAEQVPVTEEAKKVSEEELTEIQEINKVMSQITMAIGQTFISSFRALKDFDVEQSKLNDLSKVLEEKYGKVNININDGTVSPLEEDQTPS
jgi:hypothetical protein|tara:strand:+ start:108 stop:482 length:375 start_codon:yes stop_codon:yes gene_type:complete